MKAVSSIIISGVVGTTLMTLYSYYRSEKANRQYVEPVVMNKLIARAKNLPEVDNTDTHLAGWVLHYAAGVGFMASYYLLCRTALEQPAPGRVFVMGTASGFAGIMIWQVLFSTVNNPLRHSRMGYFRQLLAAHIVFAFAGVTTYNLLNDSYKRY